ncbi:MAG: hypothetical protein MR902_00540 [Campylobacter sp.]|nr:hypothetical protein [Campylobacter sp.]
MQTKKSKTVIIHGKKDEIIPISHSLNLAKFIQNGKFYKLDARHNDILRNSEFYEIFRDNF